MGLWGNKKVACKPSPFSQIFSLSTSNQSFACFCLKPLPSRGLSALNPELTAQFPGPRSSASTHLFPREHQLQPVGAFLSRERPTVALWNLVESEGLLAAQESMPLKAGRGFQGWTLAGKWWVRSACGGWVPLWEGGEILRDSCGVAS